MRGFSGSCRAVKEVVRFTPEDKHSGKRVSQRAIKPAKTISKEKDDRRNRPDSLMPKEVAVVKSFEKCFKENVVLPKDIPQGNGVMQPAAQAVLLPPPPQDDSAEVALLRAEIRSLRQSLEAANAHVAAFGNHVAHKNEMLAASEARIAALLSQLRKCEEAYKESEAQRRVWKKQCTSRQKRQTHLQMPTPDITGLDLMGGFGM